MPKATLTFKLPEDENGVPVCCQEAIDEYNAPKTEPIL